MNLNRFFSLSMNACLRHNINSGISKSLLMKSCESSILNGYSKKSISSFKTVSGTLKIKEILKANVPSVIPARNSGFFEKKTAQDLWKGVTSVSSQGRKRGRGRGERKFVKNLNRGQRIGVGEVNVVFPGLNAPVLSGKSIVQVEESPNKEKSGKDETQTTMVKSRTVRLNPLERGWTSNTRNGTDLGPPLTEDKVELTGFKTIVLESKMVKKMTGNIGQKRRVSMFVVTGNQNGCVGFTLVKGSGMASAIERARKKVGQYLLYIDICKGDTVYHDFYSECMYTKIFVKKKHEGYGLVCHRVIKEICQVVGIKNLHAKVDGSTNTQNITKAFIQGLLNQKNYQQLADEKQLYVALSPKGMPVKILATPKSGKVRSSTDVHPDEELNVNKYAMREKVEIERKKFVPFYESLPSWERHLKKMVKNRNHEKIKKQLMLEYGQVRSFLADKYPECVAGSQRKKKEESND